MSDANERSFFKEASQNVANKIIEKASDRALNAVFNFVKEKYGHVCIETRSAFKHYLENSKKRYNKVKTLVDMSEPRPLKGKNGIYVDVYVSYNSKKVLVDTVDKLLNISNNIVILGSGGTGKSFLIRHLFLNTLRKGKFIPVLIDLRKIGEQKVDELSIMDLMHSCLENFDVTLNKEQLEYSLRSGKYLILLDGLDEVREEIRGKTGQLIQKLSNKYPGNNYIISSRESGVSFKELETYTLIHISPLEKKQAIDLICKIGKSCDKVIEFSKQLDKELYKKHYEFASNPLLLSMMYITFGDNNMIPEHITDFYDSAYEALYKRHDANKEGLFKREFKCKRIGEREFKYLFAYFCFQSYFMQQYEFSKQQILDYINRGIERLRLQDSVVQADDFFDDVKDIVCLIVEDGNRYKYAHRSFQTYFAAYYTASQISDEKQRVFLKKELKKNYSSKEDYFQMLYWLERDRFDNNVLETGINEIIDKINKSTNPLFTLLSITCQQIADHDGILYRGINSAAHLAIPYTRNVVMLFENLYMNDKDFELKRNTGTQIIELLNKHTEIWDGEVEITNILNIDNTHDLELILELIYDYLETRILLDEMNKWLIQQQKRKGALTKMRNKNNLLLEL